MRAVERKRKRASGAAGQFSLKSTVIDPEVLEGVAEWSPVVQCHILGWHGAALRRQSHDIGGGCMSRATEHVHHLATTIGPRPATTDAEAEAADYLESVFAERAMHAERQEFDCPRTDSWAYVVYYLLTIGAAVASGWELLIWPALAVSAVVAFLMWMDLDMRFGLCGWLPPKGPSQNVIARHVPRVRRGESPTRVVLVAHYDSAKTSVAFTPSMAKNHALFSALARWCTLLVPAFVLVRGLPFASEWGPWSWYATVAASAYLAVPLLMNVHREVAMPAVEGANDNASGVAVMLGVMERMVPAPDEPGTAPFRPVRRGPEAALEADVLPEGAELQYTPASVPTDDHDVTELPDDFEWAEPAPEISPSQSHLEFDTIEFEAVSATPSDRDVSTAGQEERTRTDGGSTDAPVTSAPETSHRKPQAEEGPVERRGFFRRRAKRRSAQDRGGLGGWLGLGKDFDAREAGEKIGSWDNLADEDEEDGFGFKGGRAGDDSLGDPDFAASEAARIRRRVTERVDRALADKEIWFVATGAKESGAWGMHALLGSYGAELEGAFIINLDNVGSGALHAITEEGRVRRYRSDRRLISASRRVAHDSDLPVRVRPYRESFTDATRALVRGYRAMSIMAFDINGRVPNWHWRTDTEDNIDPANLQTAERFVAEVVRSL